MTQFLAVDYKLKLGTGRMNALLLYAVIMIFVYAIGIPALYIVLLWRAQGELSLHKRIEIDLAKLACSSTERAELKAGLRDYFFGEVTLGHGLTASTFDMLRTTDHSEEFAAWLSRANIPHAKGGLLLPLLEAYIKAQEEQWEEVSHDHQLSFLLGSWQQRVYWFEIFEVFRRLLLSGVLVLFGKGVSTTPTPPSAVDIL